MDLLILLACLATAAIATAVIATSADTRRWRRPRVDSDDGHGWIGFSHSGDGGSDCGSSDSGGCDGGGGGD